MREEDEKTNVRHFRMAHRYFCENGQWWFSTREGEEGPYPSREAAEAGMQRYVESIAAAKGSVRSTMNAMPKVMMRKKSTAASGISRSIRSDQI